MLPSKVLVAYKKLSNVTLNSIKACKASVQSGEDSNVRFKEPFELEEYKILFSEDVKNNTRPNEYVKIQTSEIINNMNGAISILSSAKVGLRSIDKEQSPHRAQAFTQMINLSKFMLKISKRVLSYKNLYVEKKHMQTTEVNPKEDNEKNANESYTDFEREIDLVIVREGLFDLFKKKPNERKVTQQVQSKPKYVTTKESDAYKVIVSKKTAKFMKDYAKKHNFDQKYKHAVFSYPTMDIQYDEDYGVQVSSVQLGQVYLYQELNPKDRAYVKKKYGDISEEELEKRHPELFDNRWYYDIQDAGVEYANTLSTDRFKVQADVGDGDEGLVYIDVYDMEASKSVNESYIDYLTYLEKRKIR